MNIQEFCKELKLEGKVFSILPTDAYDEALAQKTKGCTLKLLQNALDGDRLLFSKDGLSCPGAARGLGFFDGVPQIKGGFGNFIAGGCGEGFPAGERIKCCPEVAEQMLVMQPVDVLDGKPYILVQPYEDGDESGVVTVLCACDQLSALIHLFCYRRPEYDAVVAPVASGCASVFRIPLGEAKRVKPRAVIGNVDFVSRQYFPKDTYFFTVPGQEFKNMLADADGSFLFTGGWKGVGKRM